VASDFAGDNVGGGHIRVWSFFEGETRQASVSINTADLPLAANQETAHLMDIVIAIIGI
jgi:hypothetical protein